MLSFQDNAPVMAAKVVMDAMNLLIVEDNPKMRRMINDNDGRPNNVDDDDDGDGLTDDKDTDDGVTDDKDTDDDGDGEDDQPQFSQALAWLIR